jgi:hypothetical protein
LDDKKEAIKMSAYVYYHFLPDETTLCGLGWDKAETVSEAQYQKAYELLIAQRIPDCLSWCGDELLGECIDWHDGPVLSEEDEKALNGFDVHEAIRSAYDAICEMTEQEVLDLLKEHGETDTNYTVDLNHWVYGSGWSHTECFDHISERCSAEEYLKSLDTPIECPEDGDILVQISDDDGNVLSEAWVSEISGGAAQV